MPNYISDQAKDLINRLLQPLPIKRIRLAEIKDHPWVKQELPFYLQNLMNRKALLYNLPQGKNDPNQVQKS